MNTRTNRKISQFFFFILLVIFFLTIKPSIKGQNRFNLLAKSETAELVGPGLISTFYNERDFSINARQDLICFSIASFDNKKRCIVFLKKEKNAWSDPEIVSFSGTYDDLEPFFAPNSQQLFFASNRPLPGETVSGDYNIWFSEFKDDNWTIPISLDTLINQEGDEFYPSVAANGNLYFTATRKDGIGKEDIFKSEFDGKSYSKPKVLPNEVNSETYEFNAFISPDEKLLIFSSYGRKDDLGGGDLYYSKKDVSGNWTNAIHFPAPVNSEKLDYCPFYIEETQTLFFTSNRKESTTKENQTLKEFKETQVSILNGFGNIYKIKFKL